MHVESPKELSKGDLKGTEVWPRKKTGEEAFFDGRNTVPFFWFPRSLGAKQWNITHASSRQRVEQNDAEDQDISS